MAAPAAALAEALAAMEAADAAGLAAAPAAEAAHPAGVPAAEAAHPAEAALAAAEAAHAAEAPAELIWPWPIISMFRLIVVLNQWRAIRRTSLRCVREIGAPI